MFNKSNHYFHEEQHLKYKQRIPKEVMNSKSHNNRLTSTAGKCLLINKFINLLEGLPENPVPGHRTAFCKAEKAAGSFSGQLPLSQPRFVCSCGRGHFKVIKHRTHSHFQGQIPTVPYPKYTGHYDFGFWSSTVKPSLLCYSFHPTVCPALCSQAHHREAVVAHRQYYVFFPVLLLLINFLACTLLDGYPTTLNTAIVFMVASIKPFQFTAETSTHCRRSTTPPSIAWAQWEHAQGLLFGQIFDLLSRSPRWLFGHSFLDTTSQGGSRAAPGRWTAVQSLCRSHKAHPHTTSSTAICCKALLASPSSHCCLPSMQQPDPG